MRLFFIMLLVVIFKLAIMFCLCAIGYSLLVCLVKKFLKDIKL